MPGTFEKEFHRSGPGKYKDNHKTADDVGLGSTESYKFTFKSKADNGTKVTTSQEVKHKANSTISKIALKFKKVQGFHLEKFDASSNGEVSGSVAYTDAAPGVDLSLGAGKYLDKDKKKGLQSIYMGVNYVHNLLNANLKADYGKQSLAADINVGYENFLLGGTLDLKNKDGAMAPCWGGMIGTTFGNDSLLTVQTSKSMSELLLTGYFIPSPGVELAFAASQKPNEDNKDDKVVNASVRTKWALDDNGTAVTASVKTTPLLLMGEEKGAQFRVGLSFEQKLREWASLKVSGEVGIKEASYAAFGIELEAGSI